MPSQSARSRALARAVESPTTRTDLEVWDEMKFVLDTMTSRTGPLSSPMQKQDVHLKKSKLCGFKEYQHQIKYKRVIKKIHKEFFILILKLIFVAFKKLWSKRSLDLCGYLPSRWISSIIRMATFCT